MAYGEGMSLRFVPCLCLFAGLLSACSGDDAEPVSDAGLSIDLGAFDAGADAGSFDLGSQDLGTDAGPLDLGAADAGPACVTGSRVVSFDTSDGVTLQADLHVVAAGSPLCRADLRNPARGEAAGTGGGRRVVSRGGPGQRERRTASLRRGSSDGDG